MSDSTSEQATQVVELERARLGHELHDGLIPLLFASSAEIDALLRQEGMDPALSARLRRVGERLQQAMTFTRRTLSNLYPPELAGADWITAAKETVEQLFGDAATIVRWESASEEGESASDQLALPQPTLLAAYRIVVEAIRNAMAHARPTKILVTSAVTHGPRPRLSLRVVDDGCGFDPATVSGDRFGIQTMKSRARLVGGTLHIQSQPGGPTTVACDLPCETDAP